MNTNSIIDKDYQQWVQQLSKRYRQSQIKAAVCVNQEQYPGIYFTGANLENHTEVRYYDGQATNVEIGVYNYGSKIGEFLGIGKIQGEWQTFYCDPNTGKLQCITHQTDVAPILNGDNF